MGSVCAFVAAVVSFIAENIHECIFPFRGVVVDRFTPRDRPPRSEEYLAEELLHGGLRRSAPPASPEADVVPHVSSKKDVGDHQRLDKIELGALRRVLHYRCTCNGDDDAPAGTHSCRTPVVETCTIVSKISTFQPQPPTRKKKKPRRSVCILCPPSSEIFHPKREEFVCGKEEGHEKEFIRLNNLLEKPFTCTT
ncbi:unnamed protein product [Alopecurus aequalis]